AVPDRPRARPSLGDPHVRGPLLGIDVQRALPAQHRQGPDRPVDRLRPAHPDRLRPRPRAREGRGRQGRGAGQPHRRHAHPVRGHPDGRRQHLDDHQRARDVPARPLRRRRRRARCPAGDAGRHHAERHRQGVPLPRHLRLPARPQHAPDLRHDRLVGRGDPEVEPDQHLQLPPAGGRGHARAGARLRAVHRHRRAGHRARLRPGAAGALPRRRRPHLLLRQRGPAVRRGDVQDAGLRPPVGRDRPRALRCAGPGQAPPALRRAGELAGPDRGPAGEQRPAHRAGDARGHPVARRPGPRRPAPRLERGARPAAALGPAVGAADAAGAGLRDRPAGVRGPVHRLGRRRGQGGRARRRCPRGDRPGPGDGRRRRRRRVRLHEGAARLGPVGAAAQDGVRRARRRRGQPVRHHRAVPAAGRGGRRDRDRRPRHGGRGDRGGPGLAGRAGRGRRRGGAHRPARRGEDRHQPRGRLDRLRAGRRHRGGVVGGAARGVRRVPRPDGRGGGGLRERCRADRGGPRAGARRGRGDRRAAAHARRQARARRPLQRCGAGGRARPRRRLRGRLPGHPAHPGPDRRRRGAGGSARRRAVGAVGLAPGGGARRGRRPAGGRCGRRPGRGRRDHPARGRAGAQGLRRRGGLHAEGLPAHGDDGRDRHAGARRAPV
ncbi:MAG: Ethylmalonyl-CoA mutase, methylsuccinyl-CoA-forming, partial [uncultured Pseudonocardia sp.]